MARKSIEVRVAEALCKASTLAGVPHGQDVDAPFPGVAERAQNLLRPIGSYGAYVVKGDPHGWSGGGALCTIFMESKGGPGDCIMPLDYYEDGFDVADRASEALGDAYIEFINAAVACVYAV